MEKEKRAGPARTLLNQIIEWFEGFQWKRWVTYCVVLFLVGRVIDTQTQGAFPYFLIHQLLLITATTMLVFAMKSFFTDIQKFAPNSPGGLLTQNPDVAAIYENKLLPHQSSPWILVACALITGFFFTCIVLLEYIKMDIIGIYAIYIAGSSVLIGVYGYMQYLNFLWFIYAAGECDYSSSHTRYIYNTYAPAETKWIVQLAKTSQRLKNYFLFIGLIYVIEYGILIPSDKIVISEDTVLLNMPNNTAFIFSWIALFVLVIIAFPIINYVQRFLVTKLVNQLKTITIGELSELMDIERTRGKNGEERLQATVAYEVLIENVRKSKSYPINRQLSYETIMTVVTFCVHIFNLYDKISGIPQFSGLLP